MLFGVSFFLFYLWWWAGRFAVVGLVTKRLARKNLPEEEKGGKKRGWKENMYHRYADVSHTVLSFTQRAPKINNIGKASAVSQQVSIWHHTVHRMLLSGMKVSNKQGANRTSRLSTKVNEASKVAGFKSQTSFRKLDTQKNAMTKPANKPYNHQKRKEKKCCTKSCMLSRRGWMRIGEKQVLPLRTLDCLFCCSFVFSAVEGNVMEHYSCVFTWCIFKMFKSV